MLLVHNKEQNECTKSNCISLSLKNVKQVRNKLCKMSCWSKKDIFSILKIKLIFSILYVDSRANMADVSNDESSVILSNSSSSSDEGSSLDEEKQMRPCSFEPRFDGKERKVKHQNDETESENQRLQNLDYWHVLNLLFDLGIVGVYTF